MRGLELSRRFYFDAVRPVVEQNFGDIEHAAALIGHGSEVLGLDDERLGIINGARASSCSFVIWARQWS